MGFFKAYDMRGTYGVDFDLDLVYRVGLALPGVIAKADGLASAQGVRILVGRDCRTTSFDVRNALVRGLVEAGAKVSDLGLCTTPMVYFFTGADEFDGSVMITASHNPPSDNGLKVSMKTALPVGYANGLNEVERLATSSSARLSDSKVEPAVDDYADRGALDRYVEWQLAHAPKFDNLKFAVDCSNGMSSLFARKMFPNAVIINGEQDGRFPNHSPNPLKAEAREQLSALVREQGLDCGVIFDGDADRAMLVDENGDFVQPDYLVPVVAAATLSGDESARIIHDVRTSRGAIEAICAAGCEPIMVPVGHAFAKPILRREKALCGGELAGHYYFSEFFGCDSGLLAATRVLGEIAKAKRNGESFSGMMKPIVSCWANSGEVNFKVEDKPAAIERVLKTASTLAREVGRSDMDGYRIEYTEGWISVRQSNTEPYLRLLVECDTKARLDDWLAKLSAAIQSS